LLDRLGPDASVLHDDKRLSEAGGLVERLTSNRVGRSGNREKTTFFISYPRSRPQEADFVETILRRRRFEVYRDERDFSPGKSLPGEIRENICRANVFIAVWSREYACSPWCFDELQLALERNKANATRLWLLCVDETRIVPPAARDLVNYPSRTRDELEGHLVRLVDLIQP